MVELEPQSGSETEKENQQQSSQQPQQKMQPTVQIQQKNCPTCGLSLKYYQQNNRYYCQHCKKYE